MLYTLKEINTLNSSNTLFLVLNVVSYCNLTCDYCLYKNFDNNKIDFQKILKFIIYLWSNFDFTIELILVGGEPTLHPDLFDFCQKVAKYNIKFLIFSNGTAKLSVYKSILHINNSAFEFSYHAINNKINFEFIKKIKYLLSLPQYNKNLSNILINIMAETTNLKQLQQLILLFNSCQIKNEILFIAPIYKKNMLLNYDNEFIDFILTYNTRKDIIVNITNIQNNISAVSQQYLIFNQLNNFYNWHCNAGLNRLYILPNGDVYHCEEEYILKQKPFFNFYTQPYEQFTLSATKCICNMCMCNINLNKKYETSNRI